MEERFVHAFYIDPGEGWIRNPLYGPASWPQSGCKTFLCFCKNQPNTFSLVSGTIFYIKCPSSNKSMRNNNKTHMKHTMVLISNEEDCEHLGLQGPLKRLIAWKCVRYIVQSF